MKKLASFLLAACLLLSTGCSNTPAATSGQGSSQGGASASASKTDAGGEPVTISFVRTGTPEVLHKIFDPIIEKFESENPNIKVDMQDLGWGDAEKTLQAWAASETLPDVMYHLPGTVFDMADKGLVLDLNTYMDDELKNDIYPSLLQAGQYDGKQYMIPCGATSLLLWYNTDLFRKAGLDPENPPQTFEELLSAAEAITTKTGVPGIGMYAKSSGGETSFVFESLYAAASGSDSWDSEKKQYKYDDPANKDAAVSALDLMQKMTKFSQGSVSEYGRFDTRTLLRDGKVGMVLDAINMYNQCTEQVESGQIKVAQIPAGASGKQLSAINMGGWYIPANSQHPEEAWKFLRYLMNTENQVQHSTYGSVPILKSEAATYQGDYWKTVIQSVEDSVQEGISVQTNSLWAVNGEELQALMLEKQDPAKTLENINTRHAEIYNKR